MQLKKLTRLFNALVASGALATGCAATKPADLADYEAVARVTSFVGCREISQSLKRDEREAVGASLTIVLAGLSSGRLDGLDAALEEIGLRDQGHRLLVTAALQLAVRRIPEDVREHYAVGVTSAAVAGCLDGVQP